MVYFPLAGLEYSSDISYWNNVLGWQVWDTGFI